MSEYGGPPSRLRERAESMAMASKGLGAGYATNQRGTADPAEAARIAALPAAQSEAEIARAAEEADRIDSMRTDLAESFSEGWIPANEKESFSKNWEKRLETSTAEEVERWTEENAKRLSDESYDTDIYTQSDPVMDAKRRKAIEAKLEPLDLASLLFKGGVTQTVPIQNGFEPTFRSLSALHTQWLQLYMSKKDPTSQAHTQLRWATCVLAVSLQRLAGVDLPGQDLVAFNKDSQQEAFLAKLPLAIEKISAMPDEVVFELATQHQWFQWRVRKLLRGGISAQLGKS